MFDKSYFPGSFFPGSYFPPVGAGGAPPPATVVIPREHLEGSGFLKTPHRRNKQRPLWMRDWKPWGRRW